MSWCLSIPFALWLPEDSVMRLKILVGTNLRLCFQAEEIPSLNSPLLFLQEYIPVAVPYFSTCSFSEMSATLSWNWEVHFSSRYAAQQNLSCIVLQLGNTLLEPWHVALTQQHRRSHLSFNAGYLLPYCRQLALEHFPAAQLHFSLLWRIALLLDCLSVNQNIIAALKFFPLPRV